MFFICLLCGDIRLEVVVLEEIQKTKRVITKNMLIENIAEDTGYEQDAVSSVYRVLEETVFRLLSSADGHTDVSIKLFEGIALNSEFIPSKKKVNNLTGKTIKTLPKVRPRAHITESYGKKLTRG